MNDKPLLNSEMNIARNAAELARQLLMHKHVHVKLGQFLLHENLVSADVLNEAIKLQSASPHRKLGEILTQMGALTPAQAQEATMLQLEIPIVQLRQFDFDEKAISLLPRALAQKYHLMPLMLHNGSLVLAISSLPDSNTLELLRFTIKVPVELVVATQREIDVAIRDVYHQWGEVESLATLEVSTYGIHEEHLLWQEAQHLAQQEPIVKLVHTMLLDAINQQASDIHIRPNEASFEVLFRIDGTLIRIREFDKALLAPVISRIKILSKLNIAERRMPQDGRIHFQERGGAVDLRVSMIPVQYGESAVIRILDKRIGLRAIEEVGFSAEDEARFRDLLRYSHGIILVTGPTGSGKTTTLYAALQELAKENINIVTVEDPIEYDIPNTRQIQLMPAIEFSFPDALRHILRHDPDAIMIGEMRDVETCKIAVESALTGHLVLSTLHTNDASGALIRLMEIGVEPYMMRSAVIGVVAQRLVRCNCQHCLKEEVIDPIMRKNLGISTSEKFYSGIGCAHCRHTGFQGRMAVYELLVMNDELRMLVSKDAAPHQYRALAINAGMLPLTAHGVEQARAKKVSIAEVYRSCM